MIVDEFFSQYLPSYTTLLLEACIPILFGLRRLIRTARQSKIPPTAERVLILGATSGIGRAVAQQYASRGAKVCVVGRRQAQLADVVEELGGLGDKTQVLGIRGDFANVDDMVHVRGAIEQAWGGLDTMLVIAGVSALLPVMAIAGVEDTTSSASAAGIQHTVEVAAAATTGNYMGPLVAAVTFIPMLTQTSTSPSILLLSSLASLLAAPTRAVYGSTKGAALLLYQSLSIEHPLIKFSFVIPSTVEGDFRASAIDGGPVREKDPTNGLKRRAVAEACVNAVDCGTRNVFMPGILRVTPFLYWIWPSFIEWRARAKYNF